MTRKPRLERPEGGRGPVRCICAPPQVWPACLSNVGRNLRRKELDARQCERVERVGERDRLEPGRSEDLERPRRPAALGKVRPLEKAHPGVDEGRVRRRACSATAEPTAGRSRQYGVSRAHPAAGQTTRSRSRSPLGGEETRELAGRHSVPHRDRVKADEGEVLRVLRARLRRRRRADWDGRRRRTAGPSRAHAFIARSIVQTKRVVAAPDVRRRRRRARRDRRDPRARGFRLLGGRAVERDDGKARRAVDRRRRPPCSRAAVDDRARGRRAGRAGMSGASNRAFHVGTPASGHPGRGS